MQLGVVRRKDAHLRGGRGGRGERRRQDGRNVRVFIHVCWQGGWGVHACGQGGGDVPGCAGGGDVPGRAGGWPAVGAKATRVAASPAGEPCPASRGGSESPPRHGPCTPSTWWCTPHAFQHPAAVYIRTTHTYAHTRAPHPQPRARSHVHACTHTQCLTCTPVFLESFSSWCVMMETRKGSATRGQGVSGTRQS